MGNSIKLGRFLGVPVGFHWSLLAIAGLLTTSLAFGLLPDRGTAAAIVVAAVTVAAFFAAVLAHELAHSVVARHHGVEVRGITLWLLGGVARLDGEIPSARAEFRIAVAGPLTSLGIGAGLGALAVAFAAVDAPALVVGAVAWLAVVNGVLAVFNMIPAAPLDGGRVLASALWAHHGDRDRAMLGAARAGTVFGSLLVALGIVGVALGELTVWPALLGWFVISAAAAEARVANTRITLRGVRVADGMIPTVALPGWLTVDAFVDRFVDGSVPAFLVERWEGGGAGVVTLDALRTIPWAERGHTRVVELAVPIDDLRIASPNDDLGQVWTRGNGSMGLPHVVVVDHGRVVGLVPALAGRRAEMPPGSPKGLLRSAMPRLGRDPRSVS
jgi:Zn-dependent protease